MSAIVIMSAGARVVDPMHPFSQTSDPTMKAVPPGLVGIPHAGPFSNPLMQHCPGAISAPQLLQPKTVSSRDESSRDASEGSGTHVLADSPADDAGVEQHTVQRDGWASKAGDDDITRMLLQDGMDATGALDDLLGPLVANPQGTAMEDDLRNGELLFELEPYAERNKILVGEDDDTLLGALLSSCSAIALTTDPQATSRCWCQAAPPPVRTAVTQCHRSTGVCLPPLAPRWCPWQPLPTPRMRCSPAPLHLPPVRPSCRSPIRRLQGTAGRAARRAWRQCLQPHRRQHRLQHQCFPAAANSGGPACTAGPPSRPSGAVGRPKSPCCATRVVHGTAAATSWDPCRGLLHKKRASRRKRRLRRQADSLRGGAAAAAACARAYESVFIFEWASSVED